MHRNSNVNNAKILKFSSRSNLQRSVDANMFVLTSEFNERISGQGFGKMR